VTFSLIQVVAVLIFGTSSFLAGWMLRRIQSKTREAELQRHLTESKSAIGPLETHVRNRDQRIAALFGEVNDWKAKVPALDATIKRKDAEVVAKERELNVARTQVDALKAAAVPDRSMAELESLRAAVRAAEERSASLATTLAERDLRLANGNAQGTPPSVDGAAIPAIQAFEMEIAARDRSIAQLQSRLDAEIELRRGQDAAMASRDSELERVKAEANKWRLRVPKLVATIKAHDATLTAHNSLLAERDAVLTARDAQVAEHLTTIAARDATIAENAARIAERDTALAGRDTALAASEAALTQETQNAAALRGELEQQRATNAGLNTALSLRMAEISNLSSQLGAIEVQHTAATGALDARTSELEQRALVVTDLTQRNASLTGEIEQHAAKLATAVRLGREETDGHRAELLRVTEERSALERRLTETAAQFAAAQTHSAAVEQRVADADLRTRAISEQRDEFERHNAALQAEQRALEERLVAAESRRLASEQQLAVLQRTQADANAAAAAAADELRQALDAERAGKAQVVQEAEQRTAELSQMHAEARTLHTRIAPLETLLKQRDGALSERAKRIDQLTTQSESVMAQIEALQATLRQRGERIADLERKLLDPPAPPAPVADPRGDEIERLLCEQVQKNQLLSALVDERDRDLAAAAKNNDLNAKSMLVLKQQLDDARATEERLASQVRELKAAAQNTTQTAPSAAKPAMSKPPGLFTSAPERVDELQQIHGIGAGFERGLNKLGIYQLNQLAGLSADEVAWIEANLPTFHGRIERDDWPGQAAALIASSEHAEWSLRAQVDSASLSPSIN
jgi:predicted flap endonuclease-1-like 5' DNA nuclease